MKAKPIKIKINYPKPTAAEKLYAKHQALRKASGLPDPEEYKKRIAQKQAEIDALRKEEAELEEQLYKKSRFVSGPAKKPFQSNTVVSPMKEAKDGEYDYEGRMAQSQLRSLIYNCEELQDMIEDKMNLPEWCQSKITLAEDYITTVANYMRSELDESVIIEGENKQMKGEDPCWKGYEMVGKKMKKGREVPNCVPVKEGTEEDNHIEKQTNKMSRKAQIVMDIAKGKKSKQDAKDEASDKFQKDPELSSNIHKT